MHRNIVAIRYCEIQRSFIYGKAYIKSCSFPQFSHNAIWKAGTVQYKMQYSIPYTAVAVVTVESNIFSFQCPGQKRNVQFLRFRGVEQPQGNKSNKCKTFGAYISFLVLELSFSISPQSTEWMLRGIKPSENAVWIYSILAFDTKAHAKYYFFFLLHVWICSIFNSLYISISEKKNLTVLHLIY